MISTNNTAESINSPVRTITARVDISTDSTSFIYTNTDKLKSITIERIGDESKFFGYGICHKANIKLLDTDRTIDISTKHKIKVYFKTDGSFASAYPTFYVNEVRRDENTNELSITAYDILYQASKHTVSELNLTAPYTIDDFATACAYLLTGIRSAGFIGVDDATINLSYDSGANFDGTETLREALDAVAEATQTIYISRIDTNGLRFIRLSNSDSPVLAINKENYFDLDSSTNRRLASICHCTELGDNVSASLSEAGTTQYIRNNPFWELREDIAELVDNALAAVGGLTINQFSCNWRGDFRAVACDKISLTTKDNNIVTSYLLNDTISYDGTYSQNTQWSYSDNISETADNPTSLGDALKQTYARVDKANKQIDLVAGEVTNNTEEIAALQLATNQITASVQKVEQNMNNAIEGVNGDIEELTSRVEATMTADDVRIEIETELSNGVDKVTTSTGFTFNDEGLTVEKTGSEMKTQITEDGMIVYKDNEAVLTANNVGVEAVNLHATTYLIIGTNSRFEDYAYNGESRTGCFWIGS